MVSILITAGRTYDKDLIKSIMFLPEIFSCVAEDGMSKEDYEPEVISGCWLVIKDDDTVIGLYYLHAINGVAVQIHAHVLPEFRKEYSRKTGIVALEYLLANTEYKKVIAVIPVIYENVKKFTESYGFVFEGINRLSYMKNGVLVDQWMLGATRQEISEVIGWGI